ncbi:hypothetical protein XO12_10240 [Marinitoga sp. 1154]|uniref:hypothetical protein n=1 Tax=Marinitoga sp. 1154 TaxID=1643335 RepID=UPI0020CA3F4D|nr:hypothetical protein [Marinitoga sp. 1154]NUV00449.1 hypothetical protein [Marinitoga sp. 1154]
MLQSDKAIEYYLLCLKNIWRFDYRKAYKYADLTITTTSSTILKELATLEKISILFNNKKIKKANLELNKIKSEIPYINNKCRKIIIPAIRYIESRFSNFINNSGIRYWSEEYEKSEAQLSLLKYSEARQSLNTKNFKKAFDLFVEGFFHAKEFPHPTMICAGLNSAAWWIRNKDKKKALVAVELLEYYIGYYFEDFSKTYNWFDTIFEVKRINNDLGILEIINIVNQLKKYYPEINVEDKFDKKIELKKMKKKIRESYKINFEKLNKSRKEIQILFFAIYSVLIEKPYFTKNHILKLIFEGDKDKIIKYFSRDYEKMHFFNIMLSDFDVKEAEKRLTNSENFEERGYDVSPFFIARKKLITELLKNMKNFKEFILHYFDLSDEEMKIFDVFLRNCVRYDIKWPITPYPKGKILDFAIKYGFGYKRVALGYFSFEDDDRILIDEIIDKFL